MASPTDRLLALLDRHGVVRPRDVVAAGIPRWALQTLLERGEVERVSRGLYVRVGAELSANRGLAEAATRVPHGVVCLLSALAFHDLTTQLPFEVWLAISSSARTPQVEHPPFRIVRMTPDSLAAGVERHDVDGVSVPVTSVAKTIADLFKFRRRVGTDVAIDALREALAERLTSPDDVWSMAEVCRVRSVVRPYLEALS